MNLKKLYHHTPGILSDNFHLRVYVSFENTHYIKEKVFIAVSERYTSDQRQYIIGTVHFNDLYNNDWWKKEGVSLILMPDSIL